MTTDNFENWHDNLSADDYINVMKFAHDYINVMKFAQEAINTYKQPPLKRLNEDAIRDCMNKTGLPVIMLNPIIADKLLNLANAIMDEMERINRD